LKDLKKVLVIGSGPIIIGQAAEFDYSGTQACRSLKEEGLKVVLINPNPATIMTDAETADEIYMEPLTLDFVTKVLEREKPDGILPTLGGQSGLNLARELAENKILEQLEIKLLGTPLEAIAKAEDRELFKEMLYDIGEPILESKAVQNSEEALAVAATIGYPLVVRPAYTLGGSGGGFAHNEAELKSFVQRGLRESPIGQVLVERSVAGYKEIEFEVMRDSRDNCIAICSMENIDPMGVHTGDSMVVAPAQTLSDREYQMLRTSALKIIRALGIEGGSNIQFALDPKSFKYYVIEVNPRVSRSSALASKATGYPIAKVAAKVAIGLTLDKIPNSITKRTKAMYEPALDYVVVKIPRFPFDKFQEADRSLGTQMKATGEVMALGKNLEEALGKALRSLETKTPEFASLSRPDLERLIAVPNDQRFFAINEAFQRNFKVEEVHKLSGIDPFFLEKIKAVIELETKFKEEADLSLLVEAKRKGIANEIISKKTLLGEEETENELEKRGIKPLYNMVDTCAAEFEATTPYFYSTYNAAEDEVKIEGEKRAVVLGSGPIRIGQGIEFDYCSVHAVKALRENGTEAIIINNNPETVSTDFDIADRLYFEPLAFEDVKQVLEKEMPLGVMVQFGGQTAINLANRVEKAGFKILGTAVSDVDKAEDREKFQLLLEELNIPSPPGATVHSLEEGLVLASQLGYPVLLRPSYVLGGRAIKTIYDEEELKRYVEEAVIVSADHPLWLDKYLPGIEAEVDLVADGEDIIIPGIMEHLERAGVHSGDSIAVYPPLNLEPAVEKDIIDYASKLALALQIKGLLNIQFVISAGKVYVIEANPRASRTVPMISKVTGIPLVALATEVCIGKKLKESGYPLGLLPYPSYTTVKVPVFSFNKLIGAEISLGPEMKSTGEVIGIAPDFASALYKGFLAAGLRIKPRGKILATVADRDKKEILPFLAGFNQLGFEFYATKGTAVALSSLGVEAKVLPKIAEGEDDILELLARGEIDLVINTPSHGRDKESDGFKIRRAASEQGVVCLTSPDTVRALYRILLKEDFSAIPILNYKDLENLRPRHNIEGSR